jgi:multiple sugar transport system permease protein
MENQKVITKKSFKEKLKEISERYKNSKFHKKFEKVISPYLFILPYMIFFLVFTLSPVLLSIILSFLDWDFDAPAKWVGLKNFELIFNKESLTHEFFFNSLKHTFLFVGIQAPTLIIIPLLIALLLNTKIKGTKAQRILIYFPAILSVTTVSAIFFVLLDTNIGVINIFAGKEIPWLTEQPYQWISIFVMSTWWGIGGNMIYYTAGLQNISKELYEAAEVDGCSGFQKFIHITIPGLKSTFIYVVIMTILSTFNVMGQPMMLTPGEESTQVAMQYIYSVAFGGQKYGRAAAMSLIMTVIMAVFSIISFRLIVKKGDD